MDYIKPKIAIKNISLREWTNDPYKKQSWGNWLHRISPYVGRIKPAFAHFLIEYSTNKNEVILDPFCGIGTIPAEAILMGRNSVGIDLNPYAYYIALSKVDNKRNREELIEYLEKIKIDTSKINLSKIPDWVREYYNQDTLKEILFLVNSLKKDKQYFLLGCLIGISQGHRPGHLSKPCAWTLPYKPRPGDLGEYREAIPRLIEKVKRTYKDGFENIGEMKILLEDARKLPLEDNSIDHIITSPPYYDTLDYVGSSRLRLAICGYYEEDEKRALKDKLIQKFNTYIEEMTKCVVEFYRVLKPGGYCIFIVGDCFKGKKVINTAEELSPIMIENGFEIHAIIEDQIPINKSVQKRSKTQKHDRIMIMTKK